MTVSHIASILLVAFPAGEGPPDATLPAAEYGYGLAPVQAEKGWVSLFDGNSTFGWTGAEVQGDSLLGGTTTSEFGDYELRAEVVKAGTVTAGGKKFDAGPGVLHNRITGRRGPIKLGRGVAVRTLAIRPLGLQPILGGEDLLHWNRVDRANVPKEKRPVWKLENRMLHAVGGPGALEYQGRLFGDFILQLDVRTMAGYANGGVFFRSQPGLCMMGYEAQIFNKCQNNDPSRPVRYSTGAIDDRQLARRLVSRDHEFFKMTVVATGPHIATWVNGYQLTDWTDRRSRDDNPRRGLRTKPGTIQLQAHDPETDIQFKNIRAAELK